MGRGDWLGCLHAQLLTYMAPASVHTSPLQFVDDEADGGNLTARATSVAGKVRAAVHVHAVALLRSLAAPSPSTH